MDRVRKLITLEALFLYEEGKTLEEIKLIVPVLFPNHNKVNTKNLCEASLSMMKSLVTSVDQAGGCGYTVKYIRDMTVIDLIQRLSVNRVRFVYDKNNSVEKLKKLEVFIKDQIIEFKQHLKDDPSNFVASQSVAIYEELLDKI